MAWRGGAPSVQVKALRGPACRAVRRALQSGRSFQHRCYCCPGCHRRSGSSERENGAAGRQKSLLFTSSSARCVTKWRTRSAHVGMHDAVVPSAVRERQGGPVDETRCKTRAPARRCTPLPAAARRCRCARSRGNSPAGRRACLAYESDTGQGVDNQPTQKHDEDHHVTWVYGVLHGLSLVLRRRTQGCARLRGA